MDANRPLRVVFDELATGGAESGSDPAEVLRASGHADLPDGLVAEAVVSYADTAPIGVAEHLAPYVMAHSPVPVLPPDSDATSADASGANGDDGGLSWYEALATTPAPSDADPANGLDYAHIDHAGLDHPGFDHPGFDQPGPDHDIAGGVMPDGAADHGDLGFGHGDPGPDAAALTWTDPSGLDTDTTTAFDQPDPFDQSADLDDPSHGGWSADDSDAGSDGGSDGGSDDSDDLDDPDGLDGA